MLVKVIPDLMSLPSPTLFPSSPLALFFCIPAIMVFSLTGAKDYGLDPLKL